MVVQPNRSKDFCDLSHFRQGDRYGGVRVPFTDEQLTDMRGGLTAEEYRWKLIREWGEK